MGGAARMVAYRARRAEGQRVYRLPLDAVAIEAMLANAGLLETSDPTHEQVERALTRLIEFMLIIDAQRGDT